MYKNCFRTFIGLSLIVFIFGCKTESKENSIQDVAVLNYSVVSHLRSNPPGLNPITSTTLASMQVNNQLFSYLIQYDPVTLKPVPMLAKELPVIERITSGPFEGGLSCTFEIHKEANWDNGLPITGHDVAFSLKTLKTPDIVSPAIGPYFDIVKGISIDDKNEKRFTVQSDFYFMMEELFINLPILPAHHYDSIGAMKNISLADLAAPENVKKFDEDLDIKAFAAAFGSFKFSTEVDGINGSGPYKISSWETGQSIVLQKKENWWGDQLSAKYPLLQAKPNEIEFKIIPDFASAVTLLKDGALDVMHSIPSPIFIELRNNDFAKEKIALETPEVFAFYFIGINTKRDYLSNKKLRRALAHLVDIDYIINTVMDGLAQPIIGPFHPSKPYYSADLPTIDFSVEKAKKMLSELGWEDSNQDGIVDKMLNGKKKELSLDYLTTKGTGEKIALLVKDGAKAAGIEINVEVVSFQILRDRMKQRDYDLTSGALGQSPGIDDPEQLWHSKSDTPSGMNRSGFGTARSDAIIDEIQNTLDAKDRAVLYKEFQEIVYDEQPVIFLLAPLGKVAYNKTFTVASSARMPGIFENMIEQK